MFTDNQNNNDYLSDRNYHRPKELPSINNNMLSSPTILTGLSHEVRTYMNSIVAFSFLMNNDSCDDTEKNEYNRHIMNSCEQLLTLFDNFLDSALIDTEASQSNPKKCQLNDVLQGLAIDLDKSLHRYEKSMVTLVLDEHTVDKEYYLDEEKIIRVFKNLFNNALENTESGYIKFGYNLKDNRVVFYIMDSGDSYNKNKELINCLNIGNYLAKHKNTFTTVGFILARQLINSMGGELWIESNGVSGSAIYFSVPESTVSLTEKSKSEKIQSGIAI